MDPINPLEQEDLTIQLWFMGVLLVLFLSFLIPLIFPKGLKPIVVSKKLKPAILSFPFFILLNPRDQKLFLRRVQNFMKQKEFIMDPELKENQFMIKGWVAASAIAITWGYPDVDLMFIDRIYVYADIYKSERTRLMHKGEVNNSGEVRLAWNHVDAGFENPVDGVNLAIHEMAHAIRLENAIKNAEHGFIPVEKIWDFDKLAKIEMNRIEIGQHKFFRKYAATNRQEFFAVAVENFFERPEEFKGLYTELYHCLANMLNYDMLNIKQSSAIPVKFA